MQTRATTTGAAQTLTSEGCQNPLETCMVIGQTIPDVSLCISLSKRRNSTNVDACACRIISIIWKEELTLNVKFLPNEYFSKWQASGDREWAAKVGFLALYGRERQSIWSKLIYDFVEGYNEAASSKDMVSLTLWRQHLRVTKELIHEALRFISTMDKLPKNKATGLLAIMGNAPKGHKGYSVKQCVAAYCPQLGALMEHLCLQKKCLYASAALAEMIATVEKARGNFTWLGFNLGNLRRPPPTIHPQKSPRVWGTEMIDEILRRWFPYNMQILKQGTSAHKEEPTYEEAEKTTIVKGAD